MSPKGQSDSPCVFIIPRNIYNNKISLKPPPDDKHNLLPQHLCSHCDLLQHALYCDCKSGGECPHTHASGTHHSNRQKIHSNSLNCLKILPSPNYYLCTLSVSISCLHLVFLCNSEFNFPEGTNFIASKVVNYSSVLYGILCFSFPSDTRLGYTLGNINPN